MRLWVKTPFNAQPPEGGEQGGDAAEAPAAGRALLAAAAAGKKKPASPTGKVAAASVQAAQQRQEPSLASLLFDEPELQAGVAAALEAEVAAQHAAKKVGGMALKAGGCSKGALVAQLYAMHSGAVLPRFQLVRTFPARLHAPSFATPAPA